MINNFKRDDYIADENNIDNISRKIRTINEALLYLGINAKIEIELMQNYNTIETITMQVSSILDFKLYYSNYSNVYMLVYKNGITERYVELPFDFTLIFNYTEYTEEKYNFFYSCNINILSKTEYDDIDIEIEENEETEETEE